MISIIIVNYRSESYLDRCLQSIFSYSKKGDYEIVVVNNDQDETLQDIKKKYGSCRIFQSSKNVGFGAACNFGAKQSQGDQILFLNPDTCFDGDFLSQILEKERQYSSKVAIIGPRLVTDDNQTQAWSTGKDLNFSQLLKNNLGIIESRKFWESRQDVSVDWVSGASMFIKKAVFDEIGGFDESFFMYGEDMDLCARAKDLGYEIIYSPELSIRHSGGKSRENFFKQKIQFFKSSLYYLYKRSF